MTNIPTLVIIGRINTGKSTLFNRLTETKGAITSPIPGTTRDYNSGTALWRGRALNIIDTGGLDINSLKGSFEALTKKKSYPAKDSIEKNIISQTQQALRQANLILFLVDAKTGLLPPDKSLALILKSTFSQRPSSAKTLTKAKPIILVVNKIDKPSHREKVNEFFKLGLGDPIAVSAANGSGTGDLLDVIFKKLRLKKTKLPLKAKKTPLKIAIIGKPNVGKSSLLNQLSGQKRVIVSEISQTTREPQTVLVAHRGQNLIFIDTAGLKRKKPKNKIDQLSTQRGQKILKQANVVLLIIESQLPLTVQDTRLAGQIKQLKAKPIIIANKWDLVKNKYPGIEKKFIDYIHQQLPPLKKTPILFVSALTGKNVPKILEIIIKNTKLPEYQTNKH